MRVFLIVFVFVFSLFAAPAKSYNPYEGVSASDEGGDYMKNIKDVYKAKGTLVLNYSLSKSEVYENEVFYIDLVASSDENTSFELRGRFDKSDDMVFLNKKIIWKKYGKDNRTRLYFKATSQNAELSKITIDMLRNGEKILGASAIIKKMTIKKLPFKKDYANIVAKNIQTSSVKTNIFDDKSVILSIDIKGEDVDFSSFKIDNPKIIRQSISLSNQSLENANATILLTLPKDEKSFSFYYFDTQKEDFVKISSNIDVTNDEISTQSNLNPIENDMSVYWQIGFLILAISCLVLFVFFRTKYYLIAIAIVFIAISFMYQKSYKEVVLKSGSVCTILPTHNSTVFFKTEKEEKVKVLDTYGIYSKVLIGSKIGWVLNENIK